jgi:hypothetical protein
MEYTTFVTLEASHTMLVMQWLRFLRNDKRNEKQIGIGIPTDTRAMLELPEASGEAMTKGIHNVCHAGSVSHNAGNAMVEIPLE